MVTVFCNRIIKKLNKMPCLFVFLICTFIWLYLVHNRYALVHKKPSRKKNTWLKPSLEQEPNMKYLLLWTNAYTTPYVYFGTGNKVFRDKNCTWKNCFVTNDRNYFRGDYSQFDVVAFDGPQLLTLLSYGDIPVNRKLRQKYVFTNIESSSNYPLCTNAWNGFFNWTWTYKLDSDAVWGYIAIRNATNHIIGPSQNMNWLKVDDMDDIDEELKRNLSSKSETAAWFVSNCMTQSLREKYVEELGVYLKKFGMFIDTFGKCGQFNCPREIMDHCVKMLEKKYYFYLAFENAISEDYVTERIYYALKYNTVPIVFGGANYTRFLPEGTYINAYNMKAENLAAKMYQIIKSPAKYYKFFRWKKYYSYHLRNESPETDDYCKFCALMNDEELMKKTSIHDNLNEWWTGSDTENICHPTNNPRG